LRLIGREDLADLGKDQRVEIPKFKRAAIRARLKGMIIQSAHRGQDSQGRYQMRRPIASRARPAPANPQRSAQA